MQAALADILSEIPLFRGHFESYPVLLSVDGGRRVKGRGSLSFSLKKENLGWLKEIRGTRMENGGRRAVD